MGFDIIPTMEFFINHVLQYHQIFRFSLSVTISSMLRFMSWSIHWRVHMLWQVIHIRMMNWDDWDLLQYPIKHLDDVEESRSLAICRYLLILLLYDLIGATGVLLPKYQSNLRTMWQIYMPIPRLWDWILIGYWNPCFGKEACLCM